jgi:hypothetical protein
MKIRYCKSCGSILTLGICTYRKCPEKNAADTSWIINGVEYKFKEAITKAEAEEHVKKKSDLVMKLRQPENEYIKPWVPHET